MKFSIHAFCGRLEQSIFVDFLSLRKIGAKIFKMEVNQNLPYFGF